MTTFILLLLRYTLGNLLIFPLYLLSSKIRKRILFEKEYGPKKGYRVSEDIWFHVSSEGEWEQIWPVVSFFSTLVVGQRKLNMTIWFTSTSLKNKVDKILAQKTQDSRIDTYCLSLLSINPFGPRNILSYKAPKLFFMVRYDFFPELMWQGIRSGKFILLSATLKGKVDKIRRNPIKKLKAKLRYDCFDHIIASTDHDAHCFQKLLGVSENQQSPVEEAMSEKFVGSYDFRHFQIMQRQAEKMNLESTHFQDSFESLFKDYSIDKRIILGNFWFHERELFTSEFISDLKEKKILVFIAPHHLKGEEFENIEHWFEKFADAGLDTVIWDEIGIHGEGNFILCKLPGLLCEIYPYFGHAYIGNGFGRSIHSILEPFWSGAHLYCGPKTHRSTEFDFARAYYETRGKINPAVIRELHDFYPLLINESKEGNHLKPIDSDNLKLLGESIRTQRDGLLSYYKNFLEKEAQAD